MILLLLNVKGSIEVFELSRQITEYNDPESSISLSSIPVEIRLADLYESVEFES
jgi:hypothetical protein